MTGTSGPATRARDHFDRGRLPVRCEQRYADPLNGVACFAVVLVAFLIGLHQRTKRESHSSEVASLAECNRLMEIKREQSTTIAVARERAQLAAGSPSLTDRERQVGLVLFAHYVGLLT